MTVILATISNSSGVKQGAGPLSVTRWRQRAILDGSGEIEGTASAEDANASLLLEVPGSYTPYKKLITGRGQRYPLAPLSDFGTGIIDHIEQDEPERNVTVSGNDQLSELRGRTVGKLELNDGPDTPMAAADVLDAIMAPFSGSWTWTGTPSSDVLYQAAGESVLELLIKVAQLTGDHFRLGTGRELEWLAGTPVASGARIEGAGGSVALESNPDVLPLSDEGIALTAESYDVFTRAYVFGAGNEEARLTLEHTTREGAPGLGLVTDDYPFTAVDQYGVTRNYTLHIDADAPNNCYIQDDDAVADYGQIDAILTYDDIAPPDRVLANVQAASNQLFDTALQALFRGVYPQRSYSVNIATARRELLPGDTIRLVYRGNVLNRLTGRLKWMHIDEDLLMLEVTTDIDEEGGQNVSLQLATLAADRPSGGDAGLLGKALQRQQAQSAHAQTAASALEADNATTVTGLSITPGDTLHSRATVADLGGVIVGSGLSVTGGGVLSTSGGVISGGGSVVVASGKTLTANNTLTLAGTDGKTLTLTGALTVDLDTTISGGGTLALGGFTLTVPATGTAALLGVANTFDVNGSQVMIRRDTGTTSKVNALSLRHLTSGTTAAGFGAALVFALPDDGGTVQDAARLSAEWVSSAAATYAARVRLSAFYHGTERMALICDADSSAVKIGFYGTIPVARPAAYTLAGSATRTFPTDPSGAYTGIDNAQAGTVYATVADLNTLRTAVSTLIGVVRQLTTDLSSTSGVGLIA